MTDPAKKMAKAFPTLDLDDVKDDVGMPATGTENDAWLDRRISGILARFQRYTNRYLGPVIAFQDAWQPTRPGANAPAYWPSYYGGAFYLRNYPVVTIDEASEGGATIDPATIIFETSSGLLVGYGAGSRFVIPVIKYSAGFQDMPADLYEAMIGILRTLWASRSMDKSGLSVGGMTPSSLTIADVGDVALTQGGGQGFDAALTAGGDYVDPYLGPYTYLLDSYTDLRAQMGSALMPVTTVVPVVVP